MVALTERSYQQDPLDRLAAALEDLELGHGSSPLATDRDRLAASIRTYLIPRAEDPTLPMTVVFAGPTGSGKSTLVNSLTGVDMSKAGALRPTTMSPVVLATAEKAAGFEAIAGVPCEVVLGRAPILDEIVLIDTPDIDSTVTEHRTMAEILIDNADVVVFVTSALRYADDVPWQVLRRAVARDTEVVHVLNRVGSRTAGAMVDFKSRLRAAGLDDNPVTIPEHHLSHGQQQIPATGVQSLRRRLGAVAASREQSAEATFNRVLSATVNQIGELARSIDAVTDRFADREVELSIHLSHRASELEMVDIGRGLYPDPPQDDRRRSLRKWRRASVVDEAGHAHRMETVLSRIQLVIEGDLRSWLIDAGEASAPAGLEIASVMGAARPVVGSAVGGWVEYVRRVANETGEPDKSLASAVLIDAATSNDPKKAATVLFGDGSSELTGRVKRELSSRLEVVYEQIGSLVVNGPQPEVVGLDLTELRAALGAVTSTLAPAHA